MNWADIFEHAREWIYPLILIAPFIQEDTAVVGAAAYATTPGANPWLTLVFLVIGIIASDLWKYWIGRAAHVFAWTRRQAERPAVLAAQDRVHKHLLTTLLVARFLPGTRIPLFIAAGFFKAPLRPTAIIISITALVYGALVFGIFIGLGRILGEQAQQTIPYVALGLVVVVMLLQLAHYLWTRRARLSRPASEPMS
jgi:membrane protein DedA with SNARE-associated domain